MASATKCVAKGPTRRQVYSVQCDGRVGCSRVHSAAVVKTIPSSTFPGGVGVAATYLETGRRDVLQMGGR